MYANTSSIVHLVRKILVDYISQIGIERKNHYEHMHNQKFSVSPCYYTKRGYGQCDYTKKFLRDSDKNQKEI